MKRQLVVDVRIHRFQNEFGETFGAAFSYGDVASSEVKLPELLNPEVDHEVIELANYFTRMMLNNDFLSGTDVYNYRTGKICNELEYDAVDNILFYRFSCPNEKCFISFLHDLKDRYSYANNLKWTIHWSGETEYAL